VWEYYVGGLVGELGVSKYDGHLISRLVLGWCAIVWAV